MPAKLTFQRRGIVEGFFGPPWSMGHRAALFEFGANRGMNTYLYAPKDDPYHRERWTEPYPKKEWTELLKLIRLAQVCRIDFVYGFHPGKGLCFSAEEPVATLLTKAKRFYEAGVRTFAVLFDDIPSQLEHAEDKMPFDGSLAKAEGIWLKKIFTQQPAAWTDVEWWICPSYYTEDPLLARIFGEFESSFLETLTDHLPQSVACFWTGPSVVSKKITLAHARKVAKRLRRRLILWDNYPVNDLSMSQEMHLSPLTGRDPRLPEQVYGYLNNPLLQETLSFIPLATCFNYAADPVAYNPEKSWRRVIGERFGEGAIKHWRAMRGFCERVNRAKNKNLPLPLSSKERSQLMAARRYLLENRGRRWFEEFRPWLDLMEKSPA
ncbi:MAG: beta-N-acetylglucosaminidase domain-containing protein [Deltaproteobacteria bacterium]|nr:beta-N-acetylglucosaminidase domain-containing protein [Deltaproteobacteria bacterium]